MNYKQFTRLLEKVETLVPARDPDAEVGDPRGGVDAETENRRRKAKSLKSQAELIAAQVQLAKTKSDAQQVLSDIKTKQEERQKQLQDQQAAQAQQQQAQQPQY